nr:MAG TPA: hypothetical protein [Caudoviricetes sp.]
MKFITESLQAVSIIFIKILIPLSPGNISER